MQLKPMKNSSVAPLTKLKQKILIFIGQIRIWKTRRRRSRKWRKTMKTRKKRKSLTKIEGGYYTLLKYQMFLNIKIFPTRNSLKDYFQIKQLHDKPEFYINFFTIQYQDQNNFKLKFYHYFPEVQFKDIQRSVQLVVSNLSCYLSECLLSS